MNKSVQHATQSINRLSQSFTDARREFRDRPVHLTLSGGRIQDVGTRLGAQVASGEKWLTKYVVGRGYKKTDDGLTQTRKLSIKQHGIVGFGLRSAFGGVGKLLRVAPENNMAVHLADASMAGTRFVLIGLAESVCVALAFGVATGLQGAYDVGQSGVLQAKQGVRRLRNKGVLTTTPKAASDTDSDSDSDPEMAQV